jgi:hypothetical protein
MNKISVIVPCFNEEDVLPLFYKEVTHVLESIENIDYEILFINDGSHDHSEDILKLLAHKNPHCFYYSFSRNFGKEAAMYAGLENASGDDGAGDFRMMSRQMVNAILELKEYNRYMKGLFSFVGFNTKWLEFHNVERPVGKSKWNFASLFSYAFKGIFSFSSTPITIAGVIGGILIGISCIVSLCSVFVHPVSYLTSLVLFLSGLQLIFVSILGQYCSSCYFETKQRPIYIIKNTNNIHKKMG